MTNRSQYKLNQILGTLDHIHGVRINFDTKTTKQVEQLQESVLYEKQQIIENSDFNSYMTNPEYAKSMLLLEAIKIFLTEIAPKRRTRKKIKESDAYGIEEDEEELEEFLAPAGAGPTAAPIQPGQATTTPVVTVAQAPVNPNIVPPPVQQSGTSNTTTTGSTVPQAAPAASDGKTVVMGEDDEEFYESFELDEYTLPPITFNMDDYDFTGEQLRLIAKIPNRRASLAAFEYDNETDPVKKEELDQTVWICTTLALVLLNLRTYGRHIAPIHVDEVIDLIKIHKPDRIPNSGPQWEWFLRDCLRVLAEIFKEATEKLKTTGTISETSSNLVNNRTMQIQDNYMRKTNQVRNRTRVNEASYAMRTRPGATRPVDEIANAQTLLAAQDISDRLQKMAEQVAKMSVEDLMPLVDVMKRQFGQEVAQGFNDVVKKNLEELLSKTIECKDSTDDAIIAMQQGETPQLGTDMDSAEAPDWGSEETPDTSDDFDGSAPSAGASTSPLGRNMKQPEGENPKGQEQAAPEQGEEKAAAPPAEKLAENLNDRFVKGIQLIQVSYNTASGETKKSNFKSLKEYRNWTRRPVNANSDINELRVSTLNETHLIKAANGTLVVNGHRMNTKILENRSQLDNWLDLNSTAKIVGVDTDGKIHTSLPNQKAEVRLAENTNSLQLAAKMMAKKELEQSGRVVNTKTMTRKSLAIYESLLNKAQLRKIKTFEALLASSVATKKRLANVLKEHRIAFNRKLQENNSFDLLGLGQDIEADYVSNKIKKIDQLIYETQRDLTKTVNRAVNIVNHNQSINEDIALVMESKNEHPYGVIWSNKSGRDGKFFEDAKTRNYWFRLNEGKLREAVLIDPTHYDRTINGLKRSKK